MANSNMNCSVYGCHSRKGRDSDVHFHAFPKKNASSVFITNKYGVLEKVDRRKAWELALLYGKPVTDSMKVCSKHFLLTDYVSKGMYNTAPKLKHTAVPSQNVPKKSVVHKRVIDTRRRYRYEQRQMLREKNENSSAFQPCSSPQVPVESSSAIEEIQNELITYEHLSKDEKTALHALLTLHVDPPSHMDKEIQVTSGHLISSFSSTVVTEINLNALTGLHSFELLNTIEKLIIQFYSDKKMHKLSLRDRLILVFMKLKMGIKFIILSFLFKVSQTTCSNTFYELIHYLANILQSCIHWPSIDEVRQNMPLCFKDFPNVRIILDCTEIPIQKAKCLCCRIRTYSHYKGGHTVKFMVGVSPAGLITFVSKAYGGRASDKAIFEQSKIIDKMEPYIDTIMVEKGFYIDKVCEEHNIKIKRPYYLKKKKQFSPEESLENINITRARVHVERVNQRLKQFAILTNTLPFNMVKYIDDIFLVIAGIVNLQNPILANDKF